MMHLTHFQCQYVYHICMQNVHVHHFARTLRALVSILETLAHWLERETCNVPLLLDTADGEIQDFHPPPHSSNLGRKLTQILFRERNVQLTYLPVSCCCVVWFQLWTTEQCRLADALYQTRYTFIPRHYITPSIHSISFYEFTYN